MQRPTARLQVDELESRTVPSASWLPRPILHSAHVAPAAAAQDIGLPGAIHGTLTASPGIPDAGAHFAVNGSGWLLGLGQVSVSGTLQGTGFIAQGHATGQLTLTNAKGTVTVDLVGPTQQGFAPLPHRFHFTVSGGTGAYQNLKASGEVFFLQQQNGDTTTFQMLFT